MGASTASALPTWNACAAAINSGYLVQLAHITTLGFTVPDLHVVVADLGYGIDGVLGAWSLGWNSCAASPVPGSMAVVRAPFRSEHDTHASARFSSDVTPPAA
jgi:hypothetical protein